MILTKLNAENFVTLEALVELLGSSESTIRRDLDELEAAGKLRRVHGGAERLTSLSYEEDNQQKSIKNIQEKTALAQKACQLIHDDDVIFIDAGTTNEILVRLLAKTNITVVTNSIHHAAKLVEAKIPTLIIGGRVKHSTDASVGQLAINQIGMLNFNKAFLGMNGVDETCLTTPDPEEAVVKQTIIQNAKTTYILADVSKIGQYSFVKVAPLEAVTLITQKSDSDILQKIKEKTKVIEV